MAWKGRQRGAVDYKRIQTTLVNSGLQKENNALYQSISGLIDGAQTFKDGIEDSIKKSDKIELTKQVAGVLPPINGGVRFGWYVPVFTAIANVGAVVSNYAQYLVTERLVLVFGIVNIDPALPNTLTEVELDMPIHSNFQSAAQLQGLVNGVPAIGTSSFAGIIIGNVANGQGRIRFYSVGTADCDCRYHISYELL